MHIAIWFQVHDLGWLSVPAIPLGTSTTFAKLWKGPHETAALLSDVVYCISCVSSDTMHYSMQVVHYSY